MRLRPLLVAVAVVVVACADDGSSGTTSSPTTTSPAGTTTTLVTTTTSPSATSTTTSEPATTTTSPVAPCDTGGGFVEAGDIGTVGTPDGDAAGVLTIRWFDHSTCERIVIEFATAGGEAAAVARSASAVFNGRRIVRISLGEHIDDTAIADVMMGMTMADRAYVVRGLDGDLFVDIHLGAAALARAFTLDEPGRLVVDLQPGGAPIESAPAFGDHIVVLAPRQGATLSAPITVEGYSRTFEANVQVTARRGDTEVASAFTTAADWTETWGAFTVTVPSTGPGEIDLWVGEESAADGTFEGVVVTVAVL